MIKVNIRWYRTIRMKVVAVVVCDAGGVRVLAADSSEIGLDELIRNTPNLTAVLTRLSGS